MDLAAEVLNKTGISGDRRPETLDINEFAALAVFLEEAFSSE
jgi:16S rRNA A1518/A1519 N6-dimethyltransferase RsmA/KsgA/DIM1 with predicted DNA glycosylase/AP lyase activity